MPSLPAGLAFRRLHIPTSITGDDAADFHEMTRVRNLVYAEVSGHDDHAMPADELLPNFQPDPAQVRFMWLAVLDGEVVGRVGLDLPREDGARSGSWLVELLRCVWGRGIGRAAYALVEQTAREHGRTVLQSWAEHPAALGPHLAAPTGFGSVPHDHIARYFLASGHTLEQVERNSALELATAEPRLGELLAEAEAASAGYRVVQWTLPTPDEFVEGMALMKERMVTDAPAAGLEFDEERWDAERIRRYEGTYLDAGRLLLVTAAQHIDSGELVAFNELAIGKDRTAATSQHDTLVVDAHRGHRLGLLVKCAGLLAWRDIAPESPRVLTYNAEENRPMLSINEAIGFVPVAYEGAWKKVLTP